MSFRPKKAQVAYPGAEAGAGAYHKLLDRHYCDNGKAVAAGHAQCGPALRWG